jgi:hypothetical protein
MAQANNTTIQLYYSTTASLVPTGANLAYGELALNIVDGKLYFKDSTNAVSLLASTGGASGTVQSVAVTAANGFNGTVSNSTTNANITLSTTITGVLKGNGTAISAAIPSTDYAPATSGTSILKGNGSGGFSNATSGTDYAPATTGSDILSGNGAGGFTAVTVSAPLTFVGGALGLGAVTAGTSILKGDGTGGLTNATAGTDYVVPSGSITGSAGSVATTNWTISESGGKLYFAYGGVNKGSLDSTGNFIVTGNVTAFGTP